MKICRSLSSCGYEVYLVVADNKPDEKVDNINILSVPVNGTGRISRMTTIASRVYKKALSLECDIYHFHDPELLFFGLRLKKENFKVIYDSHEDVPRDILSKSYIWKPLRTVLSFVVELVENYVARKMDLIITATPFIKARFLKINKNTEVINNYPVLAELYSKISWKNRKNSVCFIGGINVERGIYEMVDAMINTNAQLVLAGEFESARILLKTNTSIGWNKVKFYGHVNREKAQEILSECKAGLVTFHPHPNHINAQPNKIFEYMSAGIPVIASDFPLWKSMIDNDHFGLCVNPFDANAIASAINFIIENPDEASQMGMNGRKAVEEKFNWENEAKKLNKIYINLLK